MADNIKKLLQDTLSKVIQQSLYKIPILMNKHREKLHFIPFKYRIFNGLLQSINIQFGNFIEKLMETLIVNEGKYELIKELSGKSSIFYLSENSEKLIDEYISKCQYNNPNDLENDNFKGFDLLLHQLILAQGKRTNKFRHDIDLLFKDKNNGVIYYLEIKFNDDHDSGKFVDINRKFIKTYAYLANHFKIKNKDEIVPVLFYFNNKRMKGNIYIPEKTIIKRGSAFFDEFLSIKYSDLNNYLKNISEDIETLKMFDDLYKGSMRLK